MINEKKTKTNYHLQEYSFGTEEQNKQKEKPDAAPSNYTFSWECWIETAFNTVYYNQYYCVITPLLQCNSDGFNINDLD